MDAWAETDHYDSGMASQYPEDSGHRLHSLETAMRQAEDAVRDLHNSSATIQATVENLSQNQALLQQALAAQTTMLANIQASLHVPRSVAPAVTAPAAAPVTAHTVKKPPIDSLEKYKGGKDACHNWIYKADSFFKHNADYFAGREDEKIDFALNGLQGDVLTRYTADLHNGLPHLADWPALKANLLLHYGNDSGPSNAFEVLIRSPLKSYHNFANFAEKFTKTTSGTDWNDAAKRDFFVHLLPPDYQLPIRTAPNARFHTLQDVIDMAACYDSAKNLSTDSKPKEEKKDKSKQGNRREGPFTGNKRPDLLDRMDVQPRHEAEPMEIDAANRRRRNFSAVESSGRAPYRPSAPDDRDYRAPKSRRPPSPGPSHPRRPTSSRHHVAAASITVNGRPRQEQHRDREREREYEISLGSEDEYEEEATR